MKNLSMINVLLNKITFAVILLISTIGAKANEPKVETPIYPYPKYSFIVLDDDCDACGCSNNGGSLGMGGVLENNFVGLRYLHQKYQSKDGIFNNSPTIDEYFNTVQVWSKIPVIQNKLEVQAFVQYHSHSRKYTNKTTDINGLGDVTLLSNYTVFMRKNGVMKDSAMVETTHMVKGGLGVKLPTGKYDQAINNTINPSFQLGTGSTDVVTNAQYLFKRNNFGTSNYLNYYVKNENDKKYRFGNQFNFSNTFFYVLKDKKEHSYVPTVGFSGEFYGENEQYNLPVKNTKGNAIFTNVGFEYNSKQLTLGTQGMLPISQNLAQGIIDVKYRTNMYINFNF